MELVDGGDVGEDSLISQGRPCCHGPPSAAPSEEGPAAAAGSLELCGGEGAPTPDTSPGETSTVRGIVGSLPTQLPEHFHILNLPSSPKTLGRKTGIILATLCDGQTKGLEAGS